MIIYDTNYLSIASYLRNYQIFFKDNMNDKERDELQWK